MNYKDKIIQELVGLGETTKTQFLLSYKQLKNEGKDNEWIYLALTEKDKEAWTQYGFGLMFDNRFRKHIDMKYNKRHTEQELKSKSIETILNEMIEED